MSFTKVLETDFVINFLKKKNLIKQYKKAKKYLVQWYIRQVDFKKRKPKFQWIWYFRINKQYRAIGEYNSKWEFIVYDISDHQN